MMWKYPKYLNYIVHNEFTELHLPQIESATCHWLWEPGDKIHDMHTNPCTMVIEVYDMDSYQKPGVYTVNGFSLAIQIEWNPLA